jgi:hypothetical protein
LLVRLAALGCAAVYWGASCQSGNELGHLSAERTGDLSYAPAPRAPFDRELDEVCGDGVRTERGEQMLMRKPYLQRTTHEGTWLMWTSRSNEPASVLVWDPSTGEEQSFEAEVDAPVPEGQQLSARVSGLVPASIHCYEVHDAQGRLAEAAGFRTAPASGAGTVQFVALGDLGQRSEDQFAVLEQLQTVPFELVLMPGDLAYDNGRLDEFEQNFFDVYAPVARHVPLMVASGNHDYGTDDAGPFRQVFALFENGGAEGLERWYSFDWGPLHVSVLDTERTGETQASWLDQDLAQSSAPWNVVLMHTPAYSSGAHGGDPAVVQHFVPVFERHGVPLVISGHDHDYERTVPLNGVTYLVTGGGGIGTREVGESSFTAFAERVGHFLHGTVDEGSITIRAIDGTGVDFDSLRLTR